MVGAGSAFPSLAIRFHVVSEQGVSLTVGCGADSAVEQFELESRFPYLWDA